MDAPRSLFKTLEKNLGHQHRKPVHLHIFPGMKLPLGTLWAQTQADDQEWEPGLPFTSKSNCMRKFREIALRGCCLHYMSSCWPAFPGHTRSHTAAINTRTWHTPASVQLLSSSGEKKHIWGKNSCSLSRLKLLLWGRMKKSVSWYPLIN